jgi:hypothetical protein
LKVPSIFVVLISPPHPKYPRVGHIAAEFERLANVLRIGILTGLFNSADK